jgi:septum formation protein
VESIILASGSLRRQKYFKMLGLPFKIMPPLVNEAYNESTPPDEFARSMAIKKVEKIIEQLNGKIPQWVFGADTLISLDGKALGKSSTREEAETTLKQLSGRTHEVITACALFCGKTRQIDCRTASTTVYFAEILPAELDWYLDTGEWQGAAGSYKIQGLAGCFVTKIEGSFTAVVGLPLRLFYRMLIENGYDYGKYDFL